MATLDLLAAVRQGDAVAAANLIRQCEGAIRRLVRMRLHNPKLRRVVDSLDICQSVLADFLMAAKEKRLPALDKEGVVKYLATMAARKIIDRARHEQRNAGGLPENWDPATETPSPSQFAARNELVARYRGLMSEREWQAVMLRQQGHTWEEIGQIVGESADSARMVCTRALTRVRKHERGGS